MQFKDIIGQEKIKMQLRQAVAEGRIPHAQLFTGVAGIGKLQLAIAYAQYLNCPHRTPEDSCGTCPTCLQYSRLQHPDLHFAFPVIKPEKTKAENVICDDFVQEFRELILQEHYFDIDDWYRTFGADNKQGLIYERESSEIMRKLNLKAFGNGYKMMIIWQAEKMNTTCANKLLKLLEEPPERTIFILITERPDMLLSTILSRTQQIRVPRLQDEEIAEALQREGVTPQNATDLAHIANGSFLLARRLSKDNEEMQRDLDAFIALMRNAYTIGSINNPQKKFDALLNIRKWSQDMADAKVGRERQKRFLQYAQRQVRENYIYNLQQPTMNYQTEAERNFSKAFAPYIHAGNVEKIMNELSKAERRIEQNGNAKMILFDFCLQLIVLVKNKA